MIIHFFQFFFHTHPSVKRVTKVIINVQYTTISIMFAVIDKMQIIIIYKIE